MHVCIIYYLTRSYYHISIISIMLLFKKEFVEPILNGRKVETRRIYKDNVCRIREGSIHKAKTNYNSKSTFATLKITYVRKQRLGDMSEEEALREGFNSLEEFRNAWVKCYGKFNPAQVVHIIGFRVINPVYTVYSSQ